ncbi:MotA/TolQ/ExbB proton channel family protein [Thalassoroseus pseudoceratinae]|uniref:MotA/TolQ/ExbB proton channel family protein n=1 Tax=Thalassoroseus pseudoceratinae TaxID=2713176 RepID=UPI00141FC3FB|nr:MotA/TolQ/ExbB proton channel family protein [Thalassoroseus pseudoceratinae]
MRWNVVCQLPWKRLFLAFALALVWMGGVAYAQESSVNTTAAGPANDGELDLRELFRAGGLVGVIIVGLSVATVALVVEHILSIRRSALMPKGLAEHTHNLILRGQFEEAKQACHENPSFLGNVIAAGVSEAEIDYSSIEKAMEDSATEQSARLFRKIEYLNVIGTLAPMLGLLGTVWGMINAFLEFEAKSNPQVSELAPGIYKALVTTLLGLSVAVPAFAAFAFFRNRIDELVAESSLTAEQVFADYRRQLVQRRRTAAQRRRSGEST